VNPDDTIPTRDSLLSRLKNWDDQESWREFFETYWQLIHRVARKAGLREDEAQDVVQETILSVAKKMPAFKYDSAQGSFRGWLSQLTRWRIINQFKKRQRQIDQSLDTPSPRPSPPGEGEADSTSPPFSASAEQSRLWMTNLEEVPDPAGIALEALWEEEWRQHMVSTARARAKTQVSPGQYQMFDLHVNQGMPVSEVATALGVNAAQIYLAKHRIARLLKKEIERLEKQSS
jgi:RNA polymerase sigma-70 factor (ECF subfamily)